MVCYNHTIQSLKGTDMSKILIPETKEKVSVTGASVDFYRFTQDATTYYTFDTSSYGPPEPMVNAMSGLKLIDSPDKKLLMINHKAPMGLFDKIGENFEYELTDLEDGKVQILFSYVPQKSETADLSDTSCSG